MWKRNIRKRNKIQGKQYVSEKGETRNTKPYYFVVKGQRLRVCKDFFLRTLEKHHIIILEEWWYDRIHTAKK